MLVEKEVMRADTDIIKLERKSKFLRPSDESARVARRKPPIRQPKKKEEAGKPESMAGAEHWRLKSEMMEVDGGLSQAHAEELELIRGHALEVAAVGHVVLPVLVQCHVG